MSREALAKGVDYVGHDVNHLKDKRLLMRTCLAIQSHQSGLVLAILIPVVPQISEDGVFLLCKCFNIDILWHALLLKLRWIYYPKRRNRIPDKPRRKIHFQTHEDRVICTFYAMIRRVSVTFPALQLRVLQLLIVVFQVETRPILRNLLFTPKLFK